jgi:hypothetical protein
MEGRTALQVGGGAALAAAAALGCCATAGRGGDDASAAVIAEVADADAAGAAAAAVGVPQRSPCGATTTLIGGPFNGVDQWLGGELSADGMIFGVPGTAKSVLKVDPSTDEVCEVGVDVLGLRRDASSGRWTGQGKSKGAIKRGQFKWLRGARAANGDIFGIPCNANTVLRISGASGEVSTIGDPALLGGHWKWHGGVLAANGNLYGCPCNAERILKIVPKTGEVSLVRGPPFRGKQKWYGSLLGGDGCMYCIPNCADAVLKFDPATESSTLLRASPQPLELGGWKWHGAAVGGDGNIYAVPAHAERVLKIVVGSGEVRQIGAKLPAGKYKWGGATRGANGDVWCFPSDTGRCLRIAMIGNPIQLGDSDEGRSGGGKALVTSEADQVSLVGASFPGKNKWQNGFLGRDGAIYGLPCNAERVLRIDSVRGAVTTLGGPWPGEEKWEGGVMAREGAIYAVPQQSKHVLKIVPGPPDGATRVSVGGGSVSGMPALGGGGGGGSSMA